MTVMTIMMVTMVMSIMVMMMMVIMLWVTNQHHDDDDHTMRVMKRAEMTMTMTGTMMIMRGDVGNDKNTATDGDHGVMVMDDNDDNDDENDALMAMS